MASSSTASSSSSSSLAMYWVIEALSELKQIELPVLKGLVSSVPNFYEEAPESVKERLALRYLEESLIRGIVGTGTIGTIDVAKSSEEVLCANLTKVVDLSKPVQNGNEIINDDIRKFIEQKRLTLPKLSLDLVKNWVLEGKLPKFPSPNKNITSMNQRQECNNTIEDQEMVTNPKLPENPNMENMQKDPLDTNQILHKGPSDTDNIVLSIDNNIVNKDPMVCNFEENQNDEHSSDDIDNFIFQKRQPCTVPKVSLRALKESILESKTPNIPSINENDNNEQERSDLQKGPSTSEKLSDAHTASTVPITMPEKNPNPNSGPGTVSSTVPEKNPNPNSGPGMVPVTMPEKDPNPNSGPSTVPITMAEINPNPGPGTVPETSSGTNDPFDDPFADLLSTQFKIAEQDMCIKCDKGGELLNCNNKDCIISVHEACLGGTDLNNFNKNVGFYCPFCVYSRATSVYNKAKNDYLLARNHLSLFVRKDKKENKSNNNKGKNVISTNDNNKNKNNEKRGINIAVEDLEKKYRYVKSGNASESSEAGERNDEREKKKRKEDEEEEIRKGNNTKRHKPTPRYTNPIAAPGMRRNIRTWTPQEEEALREGIQKFSAPINGKISWKDILAYRRHVFDKTRLPVDLKDKWRNMMKKEGSANPPN